MEAPGREEPLQRARARRPRSGAPARYQAREGHRCRRGRMGVRPLRRAAREPGGVHAQVPARCGARRGRARPHTAAGPGARPAAVKYLLHTVVISEPARPAPDPRTIAWLAAQSPYDPAISALTAGEVQKGIALLPSRRRRTALEAWLAN